MRADTLLLLARSPGVFLRPRAYILVLSHMRSYSSLLCHILGSHAEISGYAEMHVSYGGASDLMRMRARVARSLDGELSGRYVLDKLLHNEYGVARSIIQRPDVSPIFLLRRPLPSVASIVEMGREITDTRWYSDIDAVADYYIARAQRLAELAQQAPQRHLFIRAEEIVDRPEFTLEQLQEFLGLRRPLSEFYSTFPRTGQVGSGDSSSRIMAGRIVRDPTRDLPPVAVSKSQLERLIHVYDKTCRILEGRSSA
jgi:hypothetical protein